MRAQVGATRHKSKSKGLPEVQESLLEHPTEGEGSVKSKEQSSLPFEGETQVDLFKQKGIRKVFHDDQWYFSIVDVIEAITDSLSPSRYWTELRAKLTEEGGDQLFANIEKLKMPGADGRERATDAASTETLFRIIQSVPSPKAEPFKRWLAQAKE